jgi:hypothetical protein
MSGTSSAIQSWLDGIRDGLGAHARIFEDFGAEEIADLADLEEEDVANLTSQLNAAEAAPKPLQIRQIVNALHVEMAKKAVVDDAFKSPVDDAFKTPPPAAQDRGSSSAADGHECMSADEEASSEVASSEEEEEEEEEEAEEEAEEEGEEDTVPNRTERPSASTARHRSRTGKQKQGKSAAAAASGRRQNTDLFGRSSSANNRHGLGGQASAAASTSGRARRFGGLGARSKGHRCVNPCGEKSDQCKCPAESVYVQRVSNLILSNLILSTEARWLRLGLRLSGCTTVSLRLGLRLSGCTTVSSPPLSSPLLPSPPHPSPPLILTTIFASCGFLV